MLSVVESEDPEEGQVKLIMYLFPSFADFYNQLHNTDARFAAMVQRKAQKRLPRSGGDGGQGTRAEAREMR